MPSDAYQVEPTHLVILIQIPTVVNSRAVIGTMSMAVALSISPQADIGKVLSISRPSYHGHVL